MAVECDADSLSTSSACWLCLTEKELRGIRILLLCNILNGVATDCNTQTLVNEAYAAGYIQMGEKQQMAVETYLLCQFASGGGGGGSGVLEGFGSPVGVVTPTSIGQLYSDVGVGLWQSTGLTSADWTQLV